MARRSTPADDPRGTVAEIKSLLDDFMHLSPSAELRARVRALVPAFHGLRDLGSSNVSKDAADSGVARILYYLRAYPKTLIDGDELMVVSGIDEWARRTRELRREDGWWIYTGVTIQDLVDEEREESGEIDALQEHFDFDLRAVKPDQYFLAREEQDRDAAFRWKQANKLRRDKSLSVKNKVLAYLRANVGHAVTGEELRYLANDKNEWPRRTRELRTEDGWPVSTRMQGRQDLPVGTYLLEQDRQSASHDRKIKDTIRVAVLRRDGHRCVACGWSRAQLSPDDPRKFLELHHVKEHLRRGENTVANLVTLCNVDHDAVHRGELALVDGHWIRATGSV